MANNVNINYSKGGLSTPATGEDFISGMIFYTSAFPSGFSASANTQEIFSIGEAVALGITNTSIGETKASGTVTVTASGSTGAVISLVVNTVAFGTVALGSYTVQVGDTNASIATSLTSVVNAGTTTNGFTAVAGTGSTLTVSAPAQTGVGGNAFTFANTVTGGATITSSAFAGGVASSIDPIYYHIEEAFRANPTLDLWVKILTGTSASSSYSELIDLENESNGKIRQFGIYEQIAFSTGNLALIQTQITSSITNNKPFEVIYQADFSAVSNLATLTDLTSLNAPNVTVCIGQDGANVSLGGGYRLWLATGKSIGTMGITLGAVSRALVSQSIAWVDRFQMSSVELDTIAFANGTLFSSISDGLFNQIDVKGYCFLRKFVGISGSYFNNDFTAVSATSDYSSIHNNRTIHKVARNVRAQLLPAVSSPIYFNADGSVALYTIGFFESECGVALAQMLSNGEISQYKVIINAKQNVLATKVLNIQIEIIPVGVANTIVVNLGFVLSI